MPPSNLDQIIDTFGECISEFELDESEFSIEDPSTEPTYSIYNGKKEQTSLCLIMRNPIGIQTQLLFIRVILPGLPHIEESLKSFSYSDSSHSGDMSVDGSSDELGDKSVIEDESNSESETPGETKSVHFDPPREASTVLHIFHVSIYIDVIL